MTAQAKILAPGTYRTTKTVKNPKPDGRIQQNRADNWESWKEWPAGKDFIVDSDRRGNNRVYVWGGYHKAESSLDDPRLPILLEHLEQVQETPSMRLARYGSGSGAGQIALSVLDELKISLEDIEEALRRIEERDEETES
jgi:hypothetical protein